MQDLVQALTMPFVAGFVVQRLLETLDPLATARIKEPNTKKIVLGALSLVIGCLLSQFAGIRLFYQLHQVFPNVKETPYILDIFLTGVFISGGTEGFNSLLKFAGYKKEAAKADAARKRSQLTPDELVSVNP